MASILLTLKYIFKGSKGKGLDQHLVMLSTAAQKQVPKTCLRSYVLLQPLFSQITCRCLSGRRQSIFNSQVKRYIEVFIFVSSFSKVNSGFGLVSY